MKNTGRILIASIGIVGASAAQGDQCADLGLVVSAPTDALETLICESASEAVELFERCNVPAFRPPLHIEVVDELPEGCLGVFHCGESRIDVLSPEHLETHRNPESAFAFLTAEDYFRSIVVHELAHAGFDTLNCPIESCIASDEYVAYNMQVMFLSPDQQAQFAAQGETGETVSRDQISAAILFMAPDLFVQRAWAHLQQREDPCGYIGLITDGDIILDRERYTGP
ncbi:DUF6639 family protein [Nioella aestuarii]|uniref:DUF6639 family protein n=1 Tax=Nioella aestuarii TaxID=1662864 RepID=UPI003D7F6B0F